VDGSLAPDFPGITDARSMSQWDPPFPLDLGRIRKKDEDYWDLYRATPKAFVPLAVGQNLWGSRFGRISSIRVSIPRMTFVRPLPKEQEDSLSRRYFDSTIREFGESLRQRLEPEQVGFIVSDVRRAGVEAARGSTDLGEYFTYFSFFLIASAILLASLFFRLGIERRVREIGVLRASGFSPGRLRRIFFAEAFVLAFVGSLVGILGSVLYGRWMLAGLRHLLGGVSGVGGLQLHPGWAEMAAGTCTGILAATGAAALSLRTLRKIAPKDLISGELEPAALRGRRRWLMSAGACLSFLAAGIFLSGSALKLVPELPGFFGAGLLLLLSFSCLVAFLLRGRPAAVSGRGFPAWFRLGIRNTAHRPGRSLVCVVLIASATFIVVSVEAFRQDPASISLDHKSGTGGYSVVAQSVLPIVQDPNTPEGRESMGLEDPEFAQIRFQSLRMRPGDDISCLNLYAPRNPRILAVPDPMIASERFLFQAWLQSTPEQARNPWTLLKVREPDGAIPAIGDANTIQYILHRKLGDELVVPGSKGVPVRLRLVAALRDSIFQGELLVSESDFLRSFPEQEGYRFFLVDLPGRDPDALARGLEAKLGDWGVEAVSTRDRLAAYHRVENAYLSTFQSLGALGLILGTAGMATVLLRNVLERRKELALLGALGFRRIGIGVVIVSENVFLILCGLAGGTVCASVAILPAIQERGTAFPFSMVFFTPAAVLVIGIASSVFAMIAALRTPLLESLRSE
jgi:putative ABC transport system permease protein